VISEIKDDNEKASRLDALETSIRSSKNELEPYMEKNGGPLKGFGIDYNGYLFVDFDEKQMNTINESTIDKLYNIINDDAEKMKLANVPVVFEIEKKETLASRTSTWTNLIGGIKIVGGTAMSTLSFAAQDSSGNKGYVMSGHAAIDAGGIGAPIYQPNSPRQVGTVTYYNYVFADAAWVRASNVADDVYYQDTDVLKDVASYGDTTLGTKVYKSGITTGLTSGYVNRMYIYINPLQDQCTANYSVSPGDSGSPVFTVSGSTVNIVGVTRGTYGSDATFSPISGVIADLDITPLI
jgi:hypothetical protein